MPENSIGVIFLLIPIAAILNIELSTLVSSRVSDVQPANPVERLMFIPFTVIYITAKIDAITLNTTQTT
ncbi:MAG TPA: hypothetical protein VLV84_04385 [Candidatus Acidoferrales bacterium]|nr:hypothetical protein [Candidatus Acidoferrales bacterium]